MMNEKLTLETWEFAEALLHGLDRSGAGEDQPGELFWMGDVWVEALQIDKVKAERGDGGGLKTVLCKKLQNRGAKNHKLSVKVSCQ